MIIFKKYILLFITVCFSASSLWAQYEDLYFRHLNYDDIVSPSMISSIVQSDKGFIWIGTEGGLLRYDGYNFKKFVRSKEVSGTISNNRINVIYEDNNGELWIGTSNGINLFDKATSTFSPIDIQPIKGGRNYITSIIEDEYNNVWIGTNGGVKRLNREDHLLEGVPVDSDAPLFNSYRVLSLVYDPFFGVFVATSEGLRLFDPNAGYEITVPDIFKNNNSLYEAKMWKIVRESNGDLWFATKTKGVFYYNKSENEIINYSHILGDETSIASNWVHNVLPVDENTIWFATNDGLSILKKDKGEFITYKHNAYNNSTISDNEIKSFLKDKTGSIWIGTSAGGLNFFNQSNYNFINIGEAVKPNFGLTYPLVSALAKADDDALWVGTNGGGLNYLDFENKKSASYMIDHFDKKKSSNMINALANQNDTYLLCGTVNGLYAFNKKTKQFRSVPIMPLNDANIEIPPVMSLLVDKNNVIWAGTDGEGLKYIAPSGSVYTFKVDPDKNTISDNFITDIEDNDASIWVATQDGLNLIDKNSKSVIRTYRNSYENGISNNNLTTLFKDSKNRLWIGTDFGGLNYFEETTEKFYVINKSHGLTDNSIKNIFEDNEGNIWVSSDNLLFKVSFKNFNIPFNKSDLEITSFSTNDGLSIGQFSINCNIKFDDRLVYGASKGITIFSPNSIIKAPNTSDIVITKLKIHNKEVSVLDPNSPLSSDIANTSEIVLSYDQDYLELEFSAMNFVNAENNIYAYKLENGSENEDWREIGNQNNILLTDLNSGNYTFFLKTSNENNVWSPNIKTLKITILPPWWKTWWAYLIYVFLTFFITLSIVKIINNRVKLKRELFLEHVENERQHEVYKMQLNFFTNVSHEIRTPLTLISGPVEELLESFEDNPPVENKLKTIKRNSDRLLKLVNELLDFRKAEKGHMKIYCEKQDIVAFCFEIYESFKGIAVEKDIEYKFVINTNAIPVYFDKNQMEKVIYNLLANAFKFTKKNGKIVFAVEHGNVSNDRVVIKIKDNGIGIPEHSKKNIFNRFFQADDRGVQNLGSGVGLALSKSIVELHKGEITIPEEKETWANTVFQISLLLGDSHLLNTQIVNKEENLDSNIIDAENKLDQVEGIEDFEGDLVINTEKLDPSKKTILVVEDNEEVRKFIINILSEEYNVLEFANGSDALKYMEKEIPDLIISDIMMPEMDGLELCKIIKTNETTNHIPVILLTAKSSTDNKIEGLSTGADSYISKPFSTKVLKLNIINLLSSKEILRHKYSGNFIIDSELETISTPEEIFIKKLMTIIESNIENPNFDVNELVKEIGMSRTILYKKVSTLTNHSVASLIKHIRLKKAADIILNTTHPISEVAFMVGFNDRKHFSREFKKVHKLSPTMYKNAQSPVS